MKAIALGLAIAALVLSCSQVNRPGGNHLDKMNEINLLWTQIRQFRAEAGMGLEPAATMLNEYRGKTVNDAKRVCADNHRVPKPCEDTCTLSGHICENAELICKIADELGEHDRAQEKCTSAKASCREAKQRCCNCSAKPPQIAPVDPTSPPVTP
ncbi:MAG: hypothetical protein H0V17_04080 [Deltaproteobacteria bacterium]|nr:hypothetical protein [Deltaproteobacteria bacterium]